MNRTSEIVGSLSTEDRIQLEKRLLQKAIRRTKPTAARRVREPGPVPLSFAQESLWFLDQFEPNSPLYNIPCGFRLRGSLDVAALTKAFQCVVQRHEILRTHFVSINGTPMQVIGNESAFEMHFLDLSGLSEKERHREERREIDQEAKRPFNLACDPMLRVKLIRLLPEEHLLLLCIHHIAGDVWSLGVLFQEIGELYEAFREGKNSPLPDLEFHYADYAISQRERFQGQVAEKQIAYWKEKLAGDLSPLELATDRPRPPRQTFRGAREYLNFSNGLLSALSKLSRDHDVTLNITLLAAFHTLLHRYTGQETILVGSPIGVRHSSETEKLIGLVLNTVALRADFSPGLTFKELLGQVRDSVVGAFANQELPLERLVEELRLSRDSGRNPLLQALFQLLVAPTQAPKLPGIAVEPVNMETHTAKFDLTLTMIQTDDALKGELEFNTDLFDRTTVIRMMENYRTLLEGIASNPEQKIGLLPLLTASEKHKSLIEWNNTYVPFPRDATLGALFEKQAEATPDNVAVYFEGQKLTYRELNQRTNQLARYLRKLGVGPNTLVGICMERSLEMVIAIYGILKAGGAYVPFDPEYPKERLLFMMEDAQVPVVLTQQRLAELVPLDKSKVLCLDAPPSELAVGSVENLGPIAKPDNLAYVIYTSGSTGKPKGVMISHDSICNHMFWIAHRFPLNEKDNVLQKTPFSFDASVWEFFAPLLAGARLVMARPGGQRDITYVVELIIEQDITITQSVPSFLTALLDEPNIEKCKSLRWVFCGGEPMPPEYVRRFPQLLPEATLCNLYGPTEATIDVTYFVCNGEVSGDSVPIGKPIANAQVYVLDCNLQPTPIGVPGELHLGGRELALGYWRRPDLTQEKFIPNPFGERNSRLYKTGDLVRFLPDGNLQFISRIDHQVKIRGFRIELGEIECFLRQQQGVREAVVMARDEPSGKRLVAYFVPENGATVEPAELRRALKEKLPDYMVPSAFVRLETLPLTPSGKVNRKALPEPDIALDEKKFVAPRTPLEESLAQIWCELLRLKKVGIHDNFFELGGHSLLATQAISHWRNVTTATVTLREFFESPTIAALAEIISQRGTAEVIDAMPALIALPRAGRETLP